MFNHLLQQSLIIWSYHCSVTLHSGSILNLSHRLQTQNVEAFVQHQRRRFGQQHATAMDHHDLALLVLLDAIATVVELGEGGAHLVDEFAQVMQAQVLGDLLDDVG